MVSSTTCPGCGDALPATARFCAQCGQPRDAILLSLPDDPPSVPRRASVRERLHDELLEKLRLATADEYEIVHELGRGGMATVFLALDLALGRKVAIKVMSPGLLYHDDDAVERFKREARTAAQLSHPQIIPIHAVKEAAGLLFFVMQFVEGESLEAVIKRSAPLPLAQVQSLLVQIGGALAYAHRRGVVHRDVKPANIMLDAEGWPVIMDFGIAKAGEGHSRLTQTGAPIGTPAYMSPEQCIATVVGGASDQYSLGVVAYEMLTGKLPFAGTSPVAIMMAHAVDPLPPIIDLRSDCPAALAAVVSKMLDKKPENRFAQMEDAIAALRAAPATPASLATPRARPSASQQLDALRLRAAAGRNSARLAAAPAQGRRASAGAAITAPTVAAVLVAPVVRELAIGETMRAFAVPYDGRGEPLPERAAEWSCSDPSVARVNEHGELLALTAGSAEVTANIGGVRGTARVVVRGAVNTVAASVASVELHVNEPTVAVGERVTLHAICRDADGNELAERPARWTSSDHAVAQVSEDGTVYVVERGAVTIGAEIDGVSGRTQLYVSRVAVSALQIHGRVRDFAVGDEIQLGVDVADRSGSRLGGRVIAWTSTDPRVARISRTGLLTALTEGWTTILASNGAARASVDVQVTPATVAAFRLQPVASTLRLGEAWRFSALATNLRGRPVEGLEVTWASSDSSIAVVGADGVVTALRPGTVKIAAAIKGRRATAAVTVVRATRSAEG